MPRFLNSIAESVVKPKSRLGSLLGDSSRRKVAKFARDPEMFLRDALNNAIIGFGKKTDEQYAEALLRFVENPFQVAAASDVPGIAIWANKRVATQAKQRLKILNHAGRPLVSVVMAALNAEDDIARSIESLLSQSYSEVEIVVVDDGSSDSTSEVVRLIAERDSRVRLLVNPEKTGAAPARNRGLRETRGSYITFQDADDISHPERIERQLAALIRADGCVCVCNSHRENHEGTRYIVNGRRYSKNFIAMMIPREPVFSQIGYMMDLRVGEDSEYYQRVRAVFGGHREVYLHETLYRQLFSPDSLLFSNCETQVGTEYKVDYLLNDEVNVPLKEALSRLDAIRRGEVDPYVPCAVNTTPTST